MTITVSLPKEIEVRVKHLSETTGISSELIANKAMASLMEAFIEMIEDQEDLYIAEQRLADIHAGRSKTYSLEEVEKRLGLAS
jgi:RHH-type rel operon transcriptional repressor/antitoxin RelB